MSELDPVEEAANQFYQLALAVHESISLGRGAVGWNDPEALRILRGLRRQTAEELARLVCTDRHDGRGKSKRRQLHTDACVKIRDAIRALPDPMGE